MKNAPAEAVNLVDLGFMDARAKLLDIASFLDRLERFEQEDDYRVRALIDAVDLLSERGGTRCAAILDALSDPSQKPIVAAHTKGAAGAFDGGNGDVA